MDAVNEEVIYHVDGSDTIVSVNGVWDDFALANAGTAAEASVVVGRKLWTFVTDMTTRQIYQDVLARVRRIGDPVTFTFRCDAPACRRFMEMHISTVDGDRVEFRSRTVRVEQRDPQELLNPHRPESDEMLRVCGWCKKVDVNGEWVEVENATERLKLFEMDELPMITHSICNACYDRMLNEARPKPAV